MKKIFAIIGVILLILFVGALLPDESTSEKAEDSVSSVESVEEQLEDEKEQPEEIEQQVPEDSQKIEQPEQNEQNNEVLVTSQETEQTTEGNSQDTSNQPVQQEATSKNNVSVIVPKQEDTTGNLVWVPVNGGTKYHSSSSCGNMKEPKQITKEHAEANGYTACKRCY